MKNLDFLRQAQSTHIPYAFAELLYLLGNSFVVGLVLVIFTFIFYQASDKREKTNQHKKWLLNSFNILYLSIALTSVMILVNNNLARALSIGAAIALIRFRIKLGDKQKNSPILFGVVTGVACGLNEVVMAYTVTMIYGCVLLLQYLVERIYKT